MAERPEPPLDVVAAVTAALALALGKQPGQFQIRAIRPAPVPPGLSPWARAGVLEQHLTRRFFGRR